MTALAVELNPDIFCDCISESGVQPGAPPFGVLPLGYGALRMKAICS